MEKFHINSSLFNPAFPTGSMLTPRDVFRVKMGSGQNYITGVPFDACGVLSKFLYHDQWNKDQGRITDFAAKFHYILIDFKMFFLF